MSLVRDKQKSGRHPEIVILFAITGLVVSIAVHILTYFQLLSIGIFLLTSRAEWMWVGVVAFLLGWFMPSTNPRRQLRALFHWLIFACIALICYTIIGVRLYLISEHPRKVDSSYVMMRGGIVERTISRVEYHRIAKSENRTYIMYLNRAFSLVWVIMFSGVSVLGFDYISERRRTGENELSREKFVPWWYGGG